MRKLLTAEIAEGLRRDRSETQSLTGSFDSIPRPILDRACIQTLRSTR